MFDESILCFNKAKEISPGFAPAWLNKGIVFHEMGRHDEALRYYDRAINLDPKFADAWYSKASALHYLGNYPVSQKQSS
jgi:tetratricopeptide (TPR) repeat protein